MSQAEQSVNAETVEQTKRQIRSLVSEIAQLSKSDLGPDEYYPAFLQRIVSALAAIGGAVWVLGEGRRPRLSYQINLSETLLDPQSDDAQQHTRLLDAIINQKEPQLIPPMSSGTGESGASQAGNPTRYLLVVAPLTSDGAVEGLVEIFQRPNSQPATQRGYLRFLLQMCELASEWLKSQKLRQFSDRHSLWAQADHFSRVVHDSLDLRETCYTVVNEGRRLIGCDRVSVAIKKGNKCYIEAISGQDTLENRSNIVASLNALSTRVCAMGEPLWYEGSVEDLPRQIEEVIKKYVDESYAKGVYVLPLHQPERDRGQDQDTMGADPSSENHGSREVIGALIIEQIESDVPRPILEPRIDLVYEHTARAVSNSQDFNNLFLMPVWRTLGKASWVLRARTLPKTLAISGAILVALVMLAVFPWDFEMQAKGALQPVDRREVFTGVEGEVIRVLVDHGSLVNEGDLLAELRNPDLEVQLQDLLGKRDQAEKQMTAMKILLNSRSLQENERVRIGGQYAEASQQFTSLTEQIETLNGKKEKLQIRAPMKGRIISWDVKDQLLGRAVTTGQVVMAIANTETGADWELELYMPERRMGHLTAALNDENLKTRFGQKLPVRFILATDPGLELNGTVKDIHYQTNLHDEEGHTVVVRVEIKDKNQLKYPRPGASVTGDVYCGRAPIGYVWFHEAWEWIQSKVLF